ncbi:hypothetical protein ACE5IS_17265 [Leptospira wolffii]|uniref:Secreted protein n=1 Tax=Leptospira wolffii TaxID=409998 RepID=A0ABV5BSX6_9LEPT
MDGKTFLKKAILFCGVLSARFLRCDQGGESFSGNLGGFSSFCSSNSSSFPALSIDSDGFASFSTIYPGWHSEEPLISVSKSI